MNKTFKNVFAKAKLENRSCFVGFVTGMDPDFNSSKKILKELSKYCDVIEVGIPFNTSTSDSSIIMSANDRAIKSGVKTNKIFKKHSIKYFFPLTSKIINLMYYFSIVLKSTLWPLVVQFLLHMNLILQLYFIYLIVSA